MAMVSGGAVLSGPTDGAETAAVPGPTHELDLGRGAEALACTDNVAVTCERTSS